MPATTFKRRELARRANNGIEVSLFWDKVGDTLVLTGDHAQIDAAIERMMPAGL